VSPAVAVPLRSWATCIESSSNINEGLLALAGALRNFSIQVKRELDSIESDVG
jgi:hypothetical protein